MLSGDCVVLHLRKVANVRPNCSTSSTSMQTIQRSHTFFLLTHFKWGLEIVSYTGFMLLHATASHSRQLDCLAVGWVITFNRWPEKAAERENSRRRPANPNFIPWRVFLQAFTPLYFCCPFATFTPPTPTLHPSAPGCQLGQRWFFFRRP